ncbi:baseplate J/gp47 family protein [Laribacter hongkongensis]|uniref:baseplate J/gp47 family protein n=1 Tax=Laribacter hongkongensis TaxID=168471 RepID=UPI001EFC5FE1|nr:baseplate J/gp47 family protein [Laribacter hongkongensis]MCG9093471.1 baseplate J/gp47 family protein [Laribacter hongkongensis]
MAFPVPAFSAIRDALLRDISNLLPEADTGPDSDHFVRATSVASAVEGLYQHQAWIVRQIFPDTADREYLELHALLRGLRRKPATAAQGVMRLQGAAGSFVPAGLVARLGERTWRTPGGGQVNEAGTLVELASPPSSVSGQATLVSMVGGVNEEADSELLARLLELIRRPPAGGNRYDYRRWAMEVPGVSNAFVYPLRRGLGTVDVVIVSVDGLPSQETIEATQAHIDDLRPVTAKSSLVLAATEKPAAVTVRVLLDGLTLDAARAQIHAALTGYFALLAPGEVAVKSQLEALVSNIPGIVDRQMTTPAGNVAPVVDDRMVEWVRLGAVTVELLP